MTSNNTIIRRRFIEPGLLSNLQNLWIVLQEIVIMSIIIYSDNGRNYDHIRGHMFIPVTERVIRSYDLNGGTCRTFVRS